MDFVVVGFGLGALGVLLGVVVLGWLAPRSRRAAARVSSTDDAARLQAIAAEHYSTGQALLYSGGAILLVTVAALASSLDDRTGTLLVTTTATVAAIGILLAGYLQRVRNPAPPRRRTRSAPTASASMVTDPPSVDIPTFLVDEPPRVQDGARAESDVAESAEIPATSDSGEQSIVAEDRAPLLAATSGEDSSGAIERDPPGDSTNAAETTGAGVWQPMGHAAGNTSGNTDFAENDDAKNAGDVISTARSTGSSRVGPDEEDPSSGHQS